MEARQRTKGITHAQLQLVKELIDGSGISQGMISRKSAEVARAFGGLCSIDLPGSLSESTVSRMKTGSDLMKLRRRNLMLLHLTVDYINLTKKEEDVVSLQTVKEAKHFADAVLHTDGAIEGRKERFFNPNDPRHDRTAGLFGEYGVSLIESAIGKDDADSYQKLAILQRLSGNTDDAHYWNNRARSTASEVLEIADTETAAQAAFSSGRSYLFQGLGAVAEIYLALAADAGHADAAFLLGEVLEVLQREKEARRWYSTAESNGHHEAGMRLATLKDQITEDCVATP